MSINYIAGWTGFASMNLPAVKLPEGNMTVRILVPVLALHSWCSAGMGSVVVPLPSPGQDNGVTLVEAIDQRRFIRSFSDEYITLEELARILHSAQRITGEFGFRAAPSAGAADPLTVCAVIENTGTRLLFTSCHSADPDRKYLD
jgi:hypothetical protein